MNNLKPTLTIDAEKELGRKIQIGLTAETKETRNNEEKATRELLIEEGNKARELLVCDNLYYVECVARKYSGRGVEYDDLFQAGALGLTTAANKYNPDYENRFGTYALPWIKSEVIQCIANNRCIRLPKDVNKQVKQYKAVKDELDTELGRQATIEEIADGMDTTVEEVYYILDFTNSVTSLNDSVGDDLTLEDLVSDDSLDASTKLLNRSMREVLMRAVNEVLDEDELVIVSAYLGLFGQDQLSFEKIGKRFKISGEGVRKRYNKAMDKIKNSSHGLELRAYIGLEL